MVFQIGSPFFDNGQAAVIIAGQVPIPIMPSASRLRNIAPKETPAVADPVLCQHGDLVALPNAHGSYRTLVRIDEPGALFE